MKYDYADNTKLRIVLLLDNVTNKKIIKLNSKINSEIPLDFEFSENCIPHVTLISGKLKNKLNFNKISKIINNKIQQIFNKNLTINFDEFYFSPDGNWLFLSLENNDILLNFITNLREELKEYFEISDARHLHVTIAKSNNLKEKIKLVNSLEIPKKFVAKNVAIGLSGENGILLNIIKKYKINLNNTYKNNLTNN